MDQATKWANRHLPATDAAAWLLDSYTLEELEAMRGDT